MARQSAYILALCVVFLAVIGIVMLSSTGPYARELPSDDPYFAVRRQGMWLLGGFVACLLGALINYHVWGKIWILAYLAACALLILCFVEPYGIKLNGAFRWIEVSGIRFQPSEAARLAIVLAIAAWFGKNQEKVRSWKHGFLIPLVLLAIPVALIAREVDLGCATLVSCTTLVLMFLGGSRVIGLIGLGAVGGLVLWVAIQNNPERLDRVMAFRHLDDPKIQLDAGYQQYRSQLALGAGGLKGVGLGASRQKLRNLPYAHTDFILPIIGEELGLRTTLLVVLAFALIVTCGLLIASSAPDLYGRLLGSGIVCIIGFQAVINIGVTTALLPNKGIPLPFISYGGSNLVCCLAGIGILFNIYRKGIATEPKTSVAIARAKVPCRL